MRTYTGHPTNGGPQLVTVADAENNERLLDPRNDITNHSPDGFQWGYGGSGPAQLALAICADALGVKSASSAHAGRLWAVYQDFKWEFVAKIPRGQGWSITYLEVMKIIQDIEARNRKES